MGTDRGQFGKCSLQPWPIALGLSRCQTVHLLVYVVFKGRELQHIEEGRRIMATILEKLGDLAKVEKNPSMEGKRMTAMLAPKS